MIIWDVYPDSFKITGMKETHIVYKVWAKLNTYSFKKAYRLYTIGDKMADLLATYVSREKIIIQPIWSIFQENSKISKEDNLFLKTHQLTNQFIVQYSGNIGLTHKVEVMVELAEKMKEHKNILFQIIGRGPRVPVLKKMVQEKQLPNCQFLPFQSDELFPHSLSSADIGIVILDELTSKGSVPSKCYNLMSYGIPSLYIASSDSELNNYAKKYKHAKCFSEKKLLEAVDYILELNQNKSKYKILSDNSLSAANDFKRENACKFVEKYLNLQ
jgi:UDP-N-acetylglucosamine:LPS N-acetylglucosamine transferase